MGPSIGDNKHKCSIFCQAALLSGRARLVGRIG